MKTLPNTLLWSLSLGRWGGLAVRLHASFVFMAIGAIYLGSQSGYEEGWAYGLAAVAILLVSVLLHELAHTLVVVRLGRIEERWVLSPVGGLRDGRLSFEPQHDFLIAVAGPVASGLVAIVAAIALYFVAGDLPWKQMHPVYPTLVADHGTGLIIALRMAVWLNWLLLLVNLLPVQPFDGGRALVSLMGPALGPVKAQAVQMRMNWLISLALLIVAVVFGDVADAVSVPAWVSLSLLSAVIFFAAFTPVEFWEDAPEEGDLLEYDFSEGYTSLERRVDAPPAQQELGLVRGWIERRRQEKEDQQLMLELEEEEQADVLLQRLHDQGPRGLSPDDRALLNRVSVRVRARLRG